MNQRTLSALMVCVLCGPLAAADLRRERGLGEAVPEKPDQPLRRCLYLAMRIGPPA
jgi:hypothetical protein